MDAVCFRIFAVCPGHMANGRNPESGSEGGHAGEGGEIHKSAPKPFEVRNPPVLEEQGGGGLCSPSTHESSRPQGAAPPRKAAASPDDLVAAVARLLRRCLDSPPASPAANAPPQGRKVAAGPGCPDAADA